MKPKCCECGKESDALLDLFASHEGEAGEHLEGLYFCKLCMVNGNAGDRLIELAKKWL